MPIPSRRLRCEPLEDRLTPALAGDLDPTFGAWGRATLPAELAARFFNPAAVAVQADGRVVVAGEVRGDSPTYIPDIDFAATRLLPDGRVDPTFGSGGWVRVTFDPGPGSVGSLDEARAVAIQPDGRILLAGVAHYGQTVSPQELAGPADFAAVRLTPDGQLDPTFGAGGKVTVSFPGEVSSDAANAVVVQPDGRIVLAGVTYSSSQNLTSPPGAFAAVRLTTGGALDPTFGDGGRVAVPVPVGSNNSASAAAVALQPDGRIVLAGSAVAAFYSRKIGVGIFYFNSYDFAAVRLTADGQPDPTFGDGGVARLAFDLGDTLETQSERATAVGVLADGRVLLAGSASTVAGLQYVSAWLTPDGRLDPAYDADGLVTVPDLGPVGVPLGYVRAVIGPDGQVVFAGSDVVRLTPEGQLDPGLGVAGRTQRPFGGVGGIAATADGTIVFAGNETYYRGPDDFGAPPMAARMLGRASPDPLPAFPGSVLAGGPADGAARLLPPTGVPYRNSELVPFFSGVAVRTATADVTGDGVPDLIGGAGPGGGPLVKVLDGLTRAEVVSFFAFETSFTGGVFVAAADLEGDGKAEVVVTPDRGGGPVVAVYRGADLAAGVRGEVARFLGIEDPDFRGGARPALGDLNGDGAADLVISAGFLGGPRVAVFDGRSVGGAPVKLVPDFFAFEPSLRNGAFVAAGDATGDGFADLAFGGGPGGSSRVRVFDGAALLAAGGFASLDDIPSAQRSNFFAGDPSLRGGVRVALRDADGDGRADLVAGSGEGEPSRARVYLSFRLLNELNPSVEQNLDPFGAVLADGVFVG